MNRPQTIQIFLPDGSPRSVKIAEITNRVVKAVLVPRNKLEYIAGRDELKNVGVYFLFGESADKAKPMVYIGEAEDCLERIKQHNRSKEFWNYAVVMVSKINAFTKSHAKYLEHIAVAEAKEANRFDTENSVVPNKPFVTESMEADLLDSFDTIKILLSTLGFPVFDKISKESITKKELLTLKGDNLYAEGDLIDDGFVVFKGSGLKLSTTASCHDYLINLRKKLIEEQIVMNVDGNYKFMEDYVFNSPSTAGGVVLGRATNGWTSWKNKNGVTLDELKRK
ncbi:GIY-YIG nuclease family protein [Pontibacter ruber]|uniref:GIY-YIG nuclease family protein n=1 Tax=Pontibacter ruber TaxID=1343895 RepID=A0ABW5CWG3_9BACT|nr:GIY-YIG nuclease family protein [Pontibacter ruber]